MTVLAEITRLRAENDRLRRMLAESPADCPYCKLPAARMNECCHGFPGCGRADDMMLDGGPTMTPETRETLEEASPMIAIPVQWVDMVAPRTGARLMLGENHQLGHVGKRKDGWSAETPSGQTRGLDTKEAAMARVEIDLNVHYIRR